MSPGVPQSMFSAGKTSQPAEVLSISVGFEGQASACVLILTLQWIRTRPESRMSFDTLFGRCPYCQQVC